jgi:hypothetical protein
VGQALAEAWDEDGIQAGDLVLAGRIRALVEARQLERRGDPVDWRRCEIRIFPRAGAQWSEPIGIHGKQADR